MSETQVEERVAGDQLAVDRRVDVLRMPVGAPVAWSGADLEGSEAWVHELGGDTLQDLGDALETVRERKLAIPDIGPEDVPLPSFRESATNIADELENGRGFALLRGIPGLSHTLEDLQVFNWAIGLHFGEPVSQRVNGVLVGDVRNEANQSGGKPSNDKAATSLLFHADNSDITSLLCVRQGLEGGVSSLVSSMEIHNRILAERPDLLEILYEPFYNSWRGQAYPGARPFFTCPVFSFYEGRLSARYAESMLVAYEDPTLADYVPPLKSEQREALEFVQQVATRPGMGVTFRLQPGDYLIFNNYTVLHSRAEYADGEVDELRRHLLRLWLAAPKGRPLAKGFIERYGPPMPGRLRGGYGNVARPGLRAR